MPSQLVRLYQGDGDKMLPQTCHDRDKILPQMCHDGDNMLPQTCHDGDKMLPQTCLDGDKMLPQTCQVLHFAPSFYTVFKDFISYIAIQKCYAMCAF